MLSGSARKPNIIKHLLHRSQGDFVPRKICTYHASTGSALPSAGSAETSRRVWFRLLFGQALPDRVNSTARTLQTDPRPQRPAEPTDSCFPSEGR
jgi:hypothetical protein